MNHFLTTTDTLGPAIRAITAAQTIAVDTEFHSENRYRPHLLLIAVQVPDGDTYLFDPLDQSVMERIRAAMLSVSWIVHSGHHDIGLLNHAFGEVPTDIFDTQLAYGIVNTHYPASYQDVMSDTLGITLDKGATLSDWKRRPLSDDQLTYAANDVIPLPKLAQALTQQLVAAGRLDIANAAFAAARDSALSPANPDLAYLAIHSLPSLTREHAATLQALAAWRERTAFSENRSPFSVISNAALHRFSREQPTSLGSLHKNRRLSSRVIKKYGPEILDAIATAQARPEWSWPNHVRNNTSHQDRALWLDCVARSVARENQFAASLLLPKNIRDTLAINFSDSHESISDHLEWRAPMLAEALTDAIKGNTHLVFSTASAPFPVLRR